MSIIAPYVYVIIALVVIVISSLLFFFIQKNRKGSHNFRKVLLLIIVLGIPTLLLLSLSCIIRGHEDTFSISRVSGHDVCENVEILSEWIREAVNEEQSKTDKIALSPDDYINSVHFTNLQLSIVKSRMLV